MRSRRTAQDHVAEVARRRLEQLSAELAAIRPVQEEPPPSGHGGGSGEPDPTVQASTDAGHAAAPAAPPEGAGPVAGQPVGRHAHRPLGRGESLLGWLHDRLPPGLQGDPALSRGHLVVLLLLVLCAVGATAWKVAAAHGSDAPAAAATPASALVTPPSGAGTAAGVPPSAPAPGGAATSTSASSTGPEGGGASTGAVPGATASSSASVVVDVAGKVRRPGIATLPAGSRVVDALRAAGGAKHGVPLGSLNLARVLTDGEQVVVGVRPPGGVAAAAVGTASAGSSGTAGASPAPMVDVNTADQTTLEQLPGVGPVTARSILDYRTENGPFGSVDDLLGVSGIGDATLAKIAPFVTL
jgi:competence protein ComEA